MFVFLFLLFYVIFSSLFYIFLFIFLYKFLYISFLLLFVVFLYVLLFFFLYCMFQLPNQFLSTIFNEFPSIYITYKKKFNISFDNTLKSLFLLLNLLFKFSMKDSCLRFFFSISINIVLIFLYQKALQIQTSNPFIYYSNYLLFTFLFRCIRYFCIFIFYCMPMDVASRIFLYLNYEMDFFFSALIILGSMSIFLITIRYVYYFFLFVYDKLLIGLTLFYPNFIYLLFDLSLYNSFIFFIHHRFTIIILFVQLLFYLFTIFLIFYKFFGFFSIV